MSDWYYSVDSQQHGPISLDELRERLRGLPPETLIWGPGVKDWTPAQSLQELLDSPYRAPAAAFGHSAGAADVGAEPYAHWALRVAAALIDGAVFWSILITGFLIIKLLGLVDEQGDPAGIGMAIWIVVVLVALAVGIWNRLVRDGRTGRSLGRSATSTRLVLLRSGQPLGIPLCFVRGLCHTLDRLPCCVGLLWPLWDPRRQTFADKIVGSVVVQERR